MLMHSEITERSFLWLAKSLTRVWFLGEVGVLLGLYMSVRNSRRVTLLHIQDTEDSSGSQQDAVLGSAPPGPPARAV